MRHYGTVCPQFWTGRTGRTIREMAKASTAGKDVQRVALYLMTSPHANMIGLYFLPTIYICEEVGIGEADARRALQELQRLEFSFYDDQTEHVWVKEMARFQVGPALDPRDGRVKAINRLYQTTPSNPWIGPFFDRYAESFHLTTRRECAGAPPEGGPPRGALGPPILICSDPDPVPVRIRDANSETEQPVDNSPGQTGKPELATPTWIVEQWNRIDGVVPFRDEIQGELRRRIEARLKERKTRDWWVGFFEKVRRADWLCGRNQEGWAATLHWAMGPVNIGKVLAGQYESRRTTQPTNGTAPKALCNYHPADPCGLPIVSVVGEQKRCVWHNHLARHPELNEDLETFRRYWPTVHAGIRKTLTIEEAWGRTSSARLVSSTGGAHG